MHNLGLGYLCMLMAEVEFNTKHLSRIEKYDLLALQCPALLDSKADWVANTANLCSALKEVFGWLWIGVYRKISDDYLQLGPFQGPVACTFIQKGKGVCGTVWDQEKTLVVPNVNEFPGHIACSAQSQSEIVIPLYKDGEFWGVLDIDSSELNDFSDLDKRNLKQLTVELEKYL